MKLTLFSGAEHQPSTNKLSSPMKQSMLFCEVAGAHLRNHIFQSVSADKINTCVSKCVKHPACPSLNYIQSNQTCELNDAVTSDWIFAKISRSDFINDLDLEEYTHYTSQIQC